MRVMLIEDSKTMRNIQKDVLKGLGCTVTVEACDGQDALSKVDAFNPDLILCGWDMPNMDGITFVRAYRNRGRKTPILMVTMQAGKERVLEAIQAGVNNYLVKPFTPEALSQRIQETLSRARAA